MRIILICIVISLFSGLLHAQNIEVVTKDGKTVVLKDDGTWEFKVTKSTDSTVEKKADSGYVTPSSVNFLSSFNKKLPFNDLEATSVPSSFRGHDIKEIYEILDKRINFKDEFETTANYTRRITEAKSAPIYEGLPLNSMLAFVDSPPLWPSISILRRDLIAYNLRYDADKSRVTITIYAKEDPLASADDEYLPIVEVNVYPEENLLFDNLKPHLSKTEKFVTFDFELDVNKARVLKENLRVMYLFKLKPFESNFIGRYLKAELSEIWFFSIGNSGTSTNNIAYKLKIGSLKVPDAVK